MLLSVFGMASCSETEDTVDEWVYVNRTSAKDSTILDWKAGNEKAFLDTLAYAEQRIKAGDTSWKIILKWSLQGQTALDGTSVSSLSYNAEDHIVVHVLENGAGTESPRLTDSVKVSYRGRLLPSRSYTDGYVFDQSYRGEFNPKTALSSRFAFVGTYAVIDGWTTALLQMHEGDRWMVYIPYDMAYGATSSDNLPAYSMLRFDMYLDEIIKKP